MSFFKFRFGIFLLASLFVVDLTFCIDKFEYLSTAHLVEAVAFLGKNLNLKARKFLSKFLSSGYRAFALPNNYFGPKYCRVEIDY